MLLGQILSIGKNQGGIRKINMLSEDGNSSRKMSIQSLHVRNLGLKKGDWIEYEVGGYPLDPDMTAVQILQTPPGYGDAKCCGTCDYFGKRGTMFAPDMCESYHTVILKTSVCKDWRG